MKKDLRTLKEEFIKECRYLSKLSDETIRGYENCLNLFISIMPDIIYPADLSTPIVTEFFKRLETRKRIVGKGRIVKGVKKTTVATYWSKMNQFFKWLRRNKHIEESPLYGVEFPRVNYDDRKFLKKEDVDKIFAAVSHNINWSNLFVRKRNILIFTIALCCGLRKSELLGLTLNDIDMERKQLIVRAENSKSKTNRTVPLNLLVREKISDYLNERRKKEFYSEHLLVSNNKDEKFTEHGLKHLIKRVIKGSGVKFHIHRFRHTYAVNLINSGCDIAKVKQLLGHRDIRMTSAYLRCLPTKAMRGDVERITLENLL